MKTGIRPLLAATALAVAGPSFAGPPAWEELRRNDEQRLAINPASIKQKADVTHFDYLVDFRRTQGDSPVALYRSAVVSAAIRCKSSTISVVSTEVFPGNEAKGVSLGVKTSTAEESKFTAIEKGSSDVELYDRVCKGKPAPKAAAKDSKDAKKK